VTDAPFASLTVAAQEQLRALGTVRRHHRGAYLMLEGERADHVLLVRSGRLKIVRTTTDGREAVVAVRGEGELVGELNALAGTVRPRVGSVVALDDAVVQVIAADDLLTFLERHPAASLGLLRLLAARLREATSRQADAAGYDVLHRVARALVAEAERDGRVVDGGTQVGAGLSQAELAGLVAASPKSLARALAVLRNRGLVATGRRSIVIRDMDGLRDFAG
jgi:CRP/FNR family transcriptional regulator, cyclic AMP receptor protein